eukprot:1177596-Prorocentrum_minimum.AAC.2
MNFAELRDKLLAANPLDADWVRGPPIKHLTAVTGSTRVPLDAAWVRDPLRSNIPRLSRVRLECSWTPRVRGALRSNIPRLSRVRLESPGRRVGAGPPPINHPTAVTGLTRDGGRRSCGLVEARAIGPRGGNMPPFPHAICPRGGNMPPFPHAISPRGGNMPFQVRRVNQAEAAFWRNNAGVRVDWSDRILGFECGGEQWVSEVTNQMRGEGVYLQDGLIR